MQGHIKCAGHGSARVGGGVRALEDFEEFVNLGVAGEHWPSCSHLTEYTSD